VTVEKPVPSAPLPADPLVVTAPQPKVRVTLSAPSRGSVSAGVVRLTVRNTSARTVSGRVTLSGKVRGRKVAVTFGTVTFSVSPGKREVLRIVLGTTGRRALRGHARVTVASTYRMENATGATLTLRRSVRLTVARSSR
jgi:hypothetical protein